MKTSTEINSIARLVGFYKAVEYVGKAGFDAFDLSMFRMIKSDPERRVADKGDCPLAEDDYLSFVRKLKEIGLDNGIVCNQSHAPFPSCYGGMEKYLFRAIECTAEAGGKICVIHPNNDFSAEENAEMFLRLLPFAKDCGVKIATENMWNWDCVNDHAAKAACSHHDDFLKHIEVINDEYFGACLDIGHAEMKGLETSAVDMIETLNNRLIALHIHDNDRWHDSHMIPFSAKIDFTSIVAALKKIGYVGYFTLEADTYLKSFDQDSAFKGVCDLYNAAKKLADEFDSL